MMLGYKASSASLLELRQYVNLGLPKISQYRNPREITATGTASIQWLTLNLEHLFQIGFHFNFGPQRLRLAVRELP